MTGWLIYDEKQYRINQWFANAILTHCAAFCDMKLILTEKLIFGISGSRSVLYDGCCLPLPDFAVVRTIYPLLSFYLEQNGIRLFNPYPISRICNDKRMTYITAAKSGLPIMDTAFYDKRFLPENHTESAVFPCVVKSVDGHGGKEVFLVNSKEEYRNVLLQIPGDGFLVQKVCPTVGKDLRVYVLGGKILAAVLRTGKGLKSNFSLGGSAVSYPLQCHETEAVYKILACLPVMPDFVGIDFLLDRGNLIFNEIEDAVGCRMLYAAADIDAAERYCTYIGTTMRRNDG